MADSIYAALAAYGYRAREAANAPKARYTCPDCEMQWVSSDPVCDCCGKVCTSGVTSFFAAVMVASPARDPGWTVTNYETDGLG